MTTRTTNGRFASKKAAKKATKKPVKKPTRIRKQGPMWSIKPKDVDGDFRKLVAATLISLKEQIASVQTDLAVMKSGSSLMQEIAAQRGAVTLPLYKGDCADGCKCKDVIPAMAAHLKEKDELLREAPRARRRNDDVCVV